MSNHNKLYQGKSLNIVIKPVFICSNPYIYTTVVQEVYNRVRSPEVDEVEGLAAAATKHLELLKQKDQAESSCQASDSCYHSVMERFFSFLLIPVAMFNCIIFFHLIRKKFPSKTIHLPRIVPFNGAMPSVSEMI